MRCKKLLSVLLCATIIFGTVPFMAFAEASKPVLVQSGGYVYNLTADNMTDTPPKNDSSENIFGNKNGVANGMVWADKSVQANNGGFDVTLSSLCQEYLSYKNVGFQNANLGVDTVFILDLTGSMNYSMTEGNGTIDRSVGMVVAVNEAIDEMLNFEDCKNRITIYGFSSDLTNQYKNILSLGTYSNPTWDADYDSANGSGYESHAVKTHDSDSVTGKYICLKSSKITLNSTLMLNGVSATGTSTTISGGTNTQQGLIAGIQGLINEGVHTDGKGQTYDVDRAPYVLYLTDGEPSYGSQDLCFTTDNSKSGSEKSIDKMCAWSVLTAAYQKKLLKQAYENYNKEHKGDKAFEVQWFNIAITSFENMDCDCDSDVLNAQCCELLVTPSKLLSGDTIITNNLDTNIASFQSALSSAASGTDFATTFSAKQENGTYTATNTDFIYADKENVTITETAEQVDQAMEKLVASVLNLSKGKKIPITATEGNSAAANMVFSDTLGAGTEVSGITLNKGGQKYEGVKKNNIDGTVTYTFNSSSDTSFGMFVEVGVNSTNQQTIKWVVPGNELEMVTFKDYPAGTYPSENNYEYSNPDCAPLTLTYHVSINPQGGNQSFYSNDTAYCEFYVPYDNPYYYNQTITFTEGKQPSITYGEHKSVSELDGQVLKSANITNTLNYVTSNSYEFLNTNTTKLTDDITKVKIALGNNGKAAKPNLQLTKTANRKVIKSGQEITFTIIAKNIGEIGDIDAIKLSDFIKDEFTLLPDSLKCSKSSGTTFKAADDKKSVKMTISKLAAGEEIVFTYVVKATNVTDNTDIPIDYPKTEEIGETKVDDNDENKGTALTLEVGGNPDYILWYNWGDNAPAGETIPSDVLFKKEGDSTSIDTKYVKDYSKELNNKKYIFSGWTFTDESKATVTPVKNSVTFAKSDIFANGSWKVLNKKNVVHSYGTIPDGVNQTNLLKDYPLPSDSTAYEATGLTNQLTTVTVTGSEGGTNYNYTFTPTATPTETETTITFTGTWSKIKADPDKHDVSYVVKFVDKDDKELTTPSWFDRATPSTTQVEEKAKFNVDTAYNSTKFSRFDDTVKYDYTFSGWDLSGEQTMGTSDVTITGTWKKTETPKHSVSYTYGTVPNGINTTNLAKDKPLKTTFSVYEGEKIPDYENTFTYTGEASGIVKDYKFTLSDKDTVMGTTDVTIPGSWDDGTEQTKYSVTYQWEIFDGSTKLDTIPTGFEAVPTDSSTYYKGKQYTVKSRVSTATFIDLWNDAKTTKYRYTFDGFDKTGSQTMPEGGDTVTGKWSITETPKHSVTYGYGTIPNGITKSTLEAKYPLKATFSVYEGENVPAYKNTFNYTAEYNNVVTDYAFEIDTPSVTMQTTDLSYDGSWSDGTEQTKYSVTYQWEIFDSSTKLDTIPTGFEAVPTDSSTYYKGKQYTVKSRVSTATFIDLWNDAKTTKYRYTFDGFDKTGSQTMPEGGDTVTGKWSRTETPKHSVTYTYGTVPNGINTTNLAKDKPLKTTFSVYEGEKIPDYENTFTYTGEVSGIVKDYEFTLSDKDTVMGTTDVTIPGSWDKGTEQQKYSVTYQWEIFDGSTKLDTIPTGFEAVPTDSSTYYKGKQYTVKSRVSTATFIDLWNDAKTTKYRYTFNGFDKTGSQTMSEGGDTVTGKWSRTETPKHNVTYTYGTVPNGINTTNLAKDKPLKSTFSVYEGEKIPDYENTFTYTGEVSGIVKDYEFTLSDKDTVMGTTDVTIPGSWDDGTEQTKYSVTYQWEIFDGDTKITNIPSDFEAVPVDSNTYYKGKQYSVKSRESSAIYIDLWNIAKSIKYRYTFVGFDKTGSQTMPEGGDTVIGKWNRAETPKHSVTYTYGNVPSGIDTENLAKDKPLKATFSVYEGEKVPEYEETFTYTGENGGIVKDYAFTLSDKDTVMGTTDISIPGSWDNGTEQQKYSVTYQWAFYDGSTLLETIPTDFEAVPVDNNTYYANKSYTVKERIDKQNYVDIWNTDHTVKYRYSFNGFDKTGSVTMPVGGDIVTGKWSRTETPKHNVSYGYGSIPNGVSLSTLKDTKPLKDSFTLYEGEAVPNYKYEFTFTGDYNDILTDYKFTIDTPSAVMGNEDQLYNGAWDGGTEQQKYSVNYVWEIFDGATKITPIPDGFEAVPVDNDTYFATKSYTVKERESSKNYIDLWNADHSVKYRYTFNGFNKTGKQVMPKNGDTVIGKWTRTETPKHTVSYGYGNIPNGINNKDLKTLKESFKVYEGEQIPAYTDTFKCVSDYNDILKDYNFTINQGIATMGTEDILYNGTWDDGTEHQKYSVTYKWVIIVDGKELDTIPDGFEAVPVDTNTYFATKKYQVKGRVTANEYYDIWNADNTVKYRYTFASFDKTGEQMMVAGGDTVIGTWYGVEAPFGPIKYTYGDLPEGLEKDKLAEKPKDIEKYYVNEPLSPNVLPMPANQIIPAVTTDPETKLLVVTDWEFVPDEVPDKMPNGELVLSGKWVKKGDHENIDIPYSWEFKDELDETISSQDVGALPEIIKHAYVGYDYSNRVDTTYTDKTVKIFWEGEIKYDYTFSGWKPTGENFIAANNEELTGVWLRTEHESHELKYDYGKLPEGIDPKDLPKLPENKKVYEGEPTNPEKLQKLEITGPDGTKYIFTPVTPEDKMEHEDVIVTGIWTSEKAKKVTYKFNFNIPGASVPVDSNNYYKGDTFTLPSGYETYDTIYTYNSLGQPREYKFIGWEKTSGKIGDLDEIIIGQWYDSEATEYIVKYAWSCSNNGGDFKNAFKETLPDSAKYLHGQSYKIDTKYYNGFVVYNYYENTTLKLGEWKFSGWSENDGVIEFSNIIVNGTWVYNDYKVTSAISYFEPGEEKGYIKPAEKIVKSGDTIAIYLNGGEMTLNGTHYDTDELIELIVNGNISLPQPTKEGYKFSGWSVNEVNGRYVFSATWTLLDATEKTDNNENVISDVITNAVKAIPIVPTPLKGVASGSSNLPASSCGRKGEKPDFDYSDSDNSDESDDEYYEDESVPDTGSSDVVFSASFASIVSAAALMFVTRKKKKEDEQL